MGKMYCVRSALHLSPEQQQRVSPNKPKITHAPVRKNLPPSCTRKVGSTEVQHRRCPNAAPCILPSVVECGRISKFLFGAPAVHSVSVCVCVCAFSGAGSGSAPFVRVGFVRFSIGLTHSSRTHSHTRVHNPHTLALLSKYATNISSSLAPPMLSQQQ